MLSWGKTRGRCSRKLKQEAEAGRLITSIVLGRGEVALKVVGAAHPSASVGLKKSRKVDIMGLRYTSDNFRAKEGTWPGGYGSGHGPRCPRKAAAQHNTPLPQSA